MSGRETIAAATRMFDAELQRQGVTEAGRAWAMMALDPFHDNQIPIVGCPNSEIGLSYVSDVRKTMSIDAPSSVEGNWDCHIAFIPSCRCIAGVPGNGQHGAVGGVTPKAINRIEVEAEPSQYLPEGILLVCKVPTGHNTFDPTVTTASYQAISIDEFIPAGSRHEFIGGAFEVHNTTAPLNKQGSVTSYRQENLYAESSVVARKPEELDVPGNYVRVAMAPPRTLAAAKQLGGVTWEAERGALVPLVPASDDLKARPFQAVKWFLMQYNMGGGLPDGWVSQNFYEDLLCCSFLDFEYMTSGCYFTGLSEETTLELTFRGFIETFPPPGSPQVSISSPSPPLDARAMEVVSRVQSMILPAYPVSENGIGDFFRGLVGAVKTIASPAISLVREFVPAAAPAIDAVTGLAQQLTRAQRRARARQAKLPVQTPAVKLLAGAKRLQQQVAGKRPL